MLKTHAIPDAAPPTTQEIAQAIASLEARSASHADEASQTVTVSEVIQHLGLDMTPEDVLAEVQAQRAQAAKMRKPWPLRKKRMTAIITCGVLAIGLALGELLTPLYDNSFPPPAPVISQVAFLPAPRHLSIAPNTLVQDTVGHATILKTLAEIPDNHPVRCSFTSEGTADSSDPLWTLVKHNGDVYLRCWTVPMSAQAIQQAGQNTGMTLFCERGGFVNNLHATVPLTLALHNVTLAEGMYLGGRDSATAINIRLDSHAHERWQP